MVERLSGATRLFPIVGDPVLYVESPARLTRTFAQRGLDAVCIPMQVPDGDLQIVLAGLAATPNVGGLLVTMPHKFAAFAQCDSASERSELLGVVSVMRRHVEGGWHGDVLDGVSFVRAQQRRGAGIVGSRALLVGAGGAGSAIALALLDAGVGDLVIHDSDSSRLTALVDLLRGRPGGERVSAGSADPSDCALVFNATPLGMYVGDPLPVDPSLLASTMFVGDVIAGHGTTPLISAAAGVGCRTATGADMVDAVQDDMADFLMGAPASL